MRNRNTNSLSCQQKIWQFKCCQMDLISSEYEHGMCGRVAPPHATEVAFLGLLRHRTRVDVVQEIFIGVYRLVVFAELMVNWSWRWLLLECVCWWLVYPGVPWLLMHPRCAAPPSQSPISLTQARWGCKPAINNTHSTNTLHSMLFTSHREIKRLMSLWYLLKYVFHLAIFKREACKIIVLGQNGCQTEK